MYYALALVVRHSICDFMQDLGQSVGGIWQQQGKIDRSAKYASV